MDDKTREKYEKMISKYYARIELWKKMTPSEIVDALDNMYVNEIRDMIVDLYELRINLLDQQIEKECKEHSERN